MNISTVLHFPTYRNVHFEIITAPCISTDNPVLPPTKFCDVCRFKMSSNRKMNINTPPLNITIYLNFMQTFNLNLTICNNRSEPSANL